MSQGQGPPDDAGPDHKFVCRIGGYGFYKPSENAKTLLVSHPEYPGFSANKELPDEIRGNLDEYDKDELIEKLYNEFYMDLRLANE